MLLPSQKDRRRNSRQPCPHAYLRAFGRDATLVDWSFGGLGLRFEYPEGMTVGHEIRVNIFDSVSATWELLDVVVRRIEEGGTIGVEFKPDDPNVESVVIRLLHTSLADVRNPESLPASGLGAKDDLIYARRPQAALSESERSDTNLSDILRSEFE